MTELLDNAYVHAHGVLSDIGVIKGLADLHLLALSEELDKSELRGCVLGAYRTVALGGALASRFVQAKGAAKEEISRAYWGFVNESSVRGIAVDMCSTLLPDEPPATGILKNEFSFLFPRGYEIGNLYSKGQHVEAFELWRQTMKADIKTA